MPRMIELISNGPYDDGWNDITCVGCAYQEQEHLASYPDNKTVIGHIAVLPDEPWLDGPSPDGCGRNFKTKKGAVPG